MNLSSEFQGLVQRAIAGVAVVILMVAFSSGFAATPDMILVQSRIRETLVSPSVSSTAIANLRTSMLPDGSWPDIDYASTAITVWAPSAHLDRLQSLARAYAKPGSPLEGDPDLLDDIRLVFDAWTSRDPSSSNWWYNQISNPQKLGETMTLIQPGLSVAQMTAGLAIVARSYVPRSTNSGTNTGANRTDRAYASLMRGLLADNSALVSESFLAIGDTILVTTAEGIQPDFSFQQHGAQLYIQGYGSIYLSSVLRYVHWAVGTTFAFDRLQTRALVDLLLDGVQWFIRGNTADFTATGRGLTRAGQSATAAGFRTSISEALAVCEGYRSAELEMFSARLTADVAAGDASSSTALVGHRHFWRSDSTTFHRPDFSVFLKTSSTRTSQPESGNGEGLKNLHLGDGVTLIQQSGNEYDDIMPVWDWRALPGTTTEQGSYSLKPATDWGVAGTSTHAGGVSDGTDGCTAFRYQRLGVTALKSWFFIGNRMVALGAGIQAPAATNPVVTTVNQCLLNGVVTYSTAPGSSTTLGMQTLGVSNLQWIHHDGIGYFFPNGSGNATLVSESRTGTWQAINSAQSANPVTKEVFALQLGHGSPVSNATYAYIAAPVANPGDMEGHPLSTIQIDRNDTIAQAVTDASAGLTEANFWAAGTAAGITSSAASCVMVREDSDYLEVDLSDPTQANSGDLVIELDHAVAGTLHADTGITIESHEPTLRIRAAMAHTTGRSLRARFYLRPHAYQSIKIGPSADGFVYDANPDTAYGTGASLTAKLISSSGYNRFAFLRFEIPALETPPAAASLLLNITTSQTPGVHGIHPVAPSAWSESNLTWNTRPSPSGPALALWYPTVGNPVHADLTSMLPGIGPSGGNIELTIEPLTRSNDGLVNYASRENTNSALRPVLELMVPRPEIDIWRIESFGIGTTDPAIIDDNADPDGDGIPNAIEFVLGTRPAPGFPDSDSSASRPTCRMDGSRFVFSFLRSQDSAANDVFVSVSNNLQSWTRIIPGENDAMLESNPEPGKPGIDRIELSIPYEASPDSPRFLRLGFHR